MKNLLALFVLLLGSALVAPFTAAANPQDKPTVAGKWHFVLDTPGGPRELDAEFKLDGSQITGTWGQSDAKGSFADGALTMEFPFNSPEAGSGVMKLKGALKDAGLSGDWAFLDYSGTFTAARPKE